MNSQKNIDRWSGQILENPLPRWNDLPTIDLYMDQVVILLENYLSVYFANDDKFLTAPMINNYVKSKIIPPPTKKRYNRTHLAYLIFICMLKHVFPISAIEELLIAKTPAEQLPQVYDGFCLAFEKAFAFTITAEKETPLFFTGKGADLLNVPALNMALLTSASKTMTDKLMETK